MKKKYGAVGPVKIVSALSCLVLFIILLMPTDSFAEKIIDGVPFVSEAPGLHPGCGAKKWYCSEAAFLSVKRYWTLEGDLNAACGQGIDCLLECDGVTQTAYSKETFDELHSVWVAAGSPSYDGYPEGTLDIGEGDLQRVGENTDHLTYNLSKGTNEDTTMSYIEGNVDNDIPVIILTRVDMVPGAAGHFVVVVGYNKVLNQDGSVNKQSSLFYVRDSLNNQKKGDDYEDAYTYSEVFTGMRDASSSKVHMYAVAFSPDGLTKREEAVMMIQCPSGYKNYPDVGSDDWFFWPVLKATCEGVIQGYPDGMYRPANNVVKVEALKMAIEAMGGSVNSNGCSSGAPPYNDVQSDQWYCPYVKYAYERGWLDAFDAPPSFSPGADATRGWVAHIIFRAKGGVPACIGQAGSTLVLNYLTGSGPLPDDHPFVDVNQSMNTDYFIPTYCVEEMGIFEGYLNKDCDGNAIANGVSFCPEQFINRAEVVAAMMRASELESVYR